MIDLSESQQETELNWDDSKKKNLNGGTIQEVWAQLRELKREVEVARG